VANQIIERRTPISESVLCHLLAHRVRDDIAEFLHLGIADDLALGELTDNRLELGRSLSDNLC
jgi:hypothetical protein